jgi:hypothetical protein
MGFLNVQGYGRALLEGRTVTGHFRKVPALASVAYWWSDLGMAAGTPPPNYYASAPLLGRRLDKYDGIFHGDNKSPSEMFLAELMVVTPTANMVGKYSLLDYCLYYPFIDLDSTDTQEMVPTDSLDRYATEGLRGMIVAQSPTTGSGTFQFTYINQSGVEKTSPIQAYTTTGAGMGAILIGQPASAGGSGPFVKIAQNDTGIRSVKTFTNIVANGGLGAFVLVKPLADIVIREINTATELTFVNNRPGPPKICDGAFLGFIGNTLGSIATGTFFGMAKFAWTE